MDGLCLQICALNVCTCGVVSGSASLLRRAVGGKRAAQGRGKHHFQTAGEREGSLSYSLPDSFDECSK